jgi:hypothetical protein
MPLENQISPPNSASETLQALPRTSTQLTQVSARPFHHRVWSNLSGKDRPWIGWKKSARAIVFSSCQSSLDVWHDGYMRDANTLLTSRNTGLNVLVLFIPLAWLSHFHEWAHGRTFARMS